MPPGAHEADDGGRADVELQPPQRVAGEVGQHLGQRREADDLEPVAARGAQAFQLALVDVLVRLGEQLAQRAGGVGGERQEPGEGADAEGHHEDEGVHHLRHAAARSRPGGGTGSRPRAAPPGCARPGKQRSRPPSAPNRVAISAIRRVSPSRPSQRGQRVIPDAHVPGEGCRACISGRVMPRYSPMRGSPAASRSSVKPAEAGGQLEQRSETTAANPSSCRRCRRRRRANSCSKRCDLDVTAACTCGARTSWRGDVRLLPLAALAGQLLAQVDGDLVGGVVDLPCSPATRPGRPRGTPWDRPCAG